MGLAGVPRWWLSTFKPGIIHRTGCRILGQSYPSRRIPSYSGLVLRLRRKKLEGSIMAKDDKRTTGAFGVLGEEIEMSKKWFSPGSNRGPSVN